MVVYGWREFSVVRISAVSVLSSMTPAATAFSASLWARAGSTYLTRIARRSRKELAYFSHWLTSPP